MEPKPKKKWVRWTQAEIDAMDGCVTLQEASRKIGTRTVSEVKSWRHQHGYPVLLDEESPNYELNVRRREADIAAGGTGSGARKVGKSVRQAPRWPKRGGFQGMSGSGGDQSA